MFSNNYVTEDEIKNKKSYFGNNMNTYETKIYSSSKPPSGRNITMDSINKNKILSEQNYLKKSYNDSESDDSISNNYKRFVKKNLINKKQDHGRNKFSLF